MTGQRLRAHRAGRGRAIAREVRSARSRRSDPGQVPESSRRSGSVDNESRGVRRTRGLVLQHGCCRQGFLHKGIVHHQIRPAVMCDEVNALLRIGRTQRCRRSPRAHDTQQRRNIGGTALHEDRIHLLWLGTMRDKGRRNVLRLLVQLGIRYCVVVIHEGRLLGINASVHLKMGYDVMHGSLLRVVTDSMCSVVIRQQDRRVPAFHTHSICHP